jgi:hypothetical protein
MINLDELDLNARIKEHGSNPEGVTLGELGICLQQLAVLAYGYFRYKEVKKALHNMPALHSGNVAQDVSKLIGVLLAVLSLPNVSPVILEAIRGSGDWVKWAENLLSGGEVSYVPCDEQKLRESIAALVHQAPQWSVWAHLRLGRGGLTLEPDVNLRRALGDKLDEADGWSAWAAKALGLSEAYVTEQKLTTDDLRRMISERL